MVILRDPITQDAQRVNAEGQAITRSIVESEIEHASNEGLAYVAHSSYDPASADEIIYLENENSDKTIHIETIVVSATAQGIMTIIEVTSGTATGTIVTPLNLNLGSAKVADVTAFGNASVTGTVAGDTIVSAEIGASDPFAFEFGGGLIVPKDSAVAVNWIGTATGCTADIVFHFEDV